MQRTGWQQSVNTTGSSGTAVVETSNVTNPQGTASTTTTSTLSILASVSEAARENAHTNPVDETTGTPFEIGLSAALSCSGQPLGTPSFAMYSVVKTTGPLAVASQTVASFLLGKNASTLAVSSVVETDLPSCVASIASVPGQPLETSSPPLAMTADDKTTGALSNANLTVAPCPIEGTASTLLGVSSMVEIDMPSCVASIASVPGQPLETSSPPLAMTADDKTTGALSNANLTVAPCPIEGTASTLLGVSSMVEIDMPSCVASIASVPGQPLETSSPPLAMTADDKTTGALSNANLTVALCPIEGTASTLLGVSSRIEMDLFSSVTSIASVPGQPLKTSEFLAENSVDETPGTPLVTYQTVAPCLYEETANTLAVSSMDEMDDSSSTETPIASFPVSFFMNLACLQLLVIFMFYFLTYAP